MGTKDQEKKIKKKYGRKTNGKNDTGRPTKYDEIVVQKLEEMFHIDATVEEACSQAGIKETTYYHRCEIYPEFKDRMKRAKNRLFIYAKKKHIQHMNSKDERISQQATIEFLKRREPERRDKQDINQTNETNVKLNDEDLKIIEDLLK